MITTVTTATPILSLGTTGGVDVTVTNRNTGGVTKSQLNGATYDNIAIRGILVENRGNYRLNGALPVINLVEQPLEDKVRVEVLKGASSLYYGFVPPSGVINMTTTAARVAPLAAAAAVPPSALYATAAPATPLLVGSGIRFSKRKSHQGEPWRQ